MCLNYKNASPLYNETECKDAVQMNEYGGQEMDKLYFSKGLPIVLGCDGADFKLVGVDNYYRHVGRVWETPFFASYNSTVKMEISLSKSLAKEYVEAMRVQIFGRKDGQYVKSENISLCFVGLPYPFPSAKKQFCLQIMNRYFGRSEPSLWFPSMDG